MSFAAPHYLLWLLGVLFLIALVFFAGQQRRRDIDTLISKEMLHRLSTHRRGLSYQASGLLVIFAALAIVIALSRPRYGLDTITTKSLGADIFIVLDISRSMDSLDNQTTQTPRLTRAKRKIKDFLRVAKGERAGLIVFAGDAYVDCPLTRDYQAFEHFLDNVSPENMPTQGTDLGHALRIAARAFELAKSSGRRQIVVLTDGEDHEGGLGEAIEILKKAKIEVSALGFGSPEGSPLSDGDGRFLRDQRGETILSRLEEGPLQQLASQSGGLYQRARSDDEDWIALLEHGAKKDEISQTTQERIVYRELYPIFLVIAFLLLFCESILPRRSLS